MYITRLLHIINCMIAIHHRTATHHMHVTWPNTSFPFSFSFTDNLSFWAAGMFNSKMRIGQTKINMVGEEGVEEDITFVRELCRYFSLGWSCGLVFWLCVHLSSLLLSVVLVPCLVVMGHDPRWVVLLRHRRSIWLLKSYKHKQVIATRGGSLGIMIWVAIPGLQGTRLAIREVNYVVSFNMLHLLYQTCFWLNLQDYYYAHKCIQLLWD